MGAAADRMRDLVIESGDVMKYGHRLRTGKAIKDDNNEDMEACLMDSMLHGQRSNKSESGLQDSALNTADLNDTENFPMALTPEQIAFKDFF